MAGLLTRLRQRFHGSLRFKLLALALLPLLIAVPILIAILSSWGAVYFDRLLIGKVRSDLAVAHGYFEQVKEGVGRRVEALASSEPLARSLRVRPMASDSQNDLVSALLEAERLRLGMDYLMLLDRSGRVRAASTRSLRGQSYEIAAGRLTQAMAHTEIDILSPGTLAAIDPELAAKALTPLINTRNAAATTQSEEARGMVIQSVAPVNFGGEGSAKPAVLVGGVLLNKNLDFVDRINDIVYPDGALPAGSSGTATLFLEDVRIATNVRLFEGDRAIGTRVSNEVRNRVLTEGDTWLARAFVVNDWYVSAYEPIHDSNGQRVGMLYVGFLEAPFQQARWLTLVAVSILFLLTATGAAIVSLRLARHVSVPVARMHGVMSALESGGETEMRRVRVGPLTGSDEFDELAELGAHFDRLLDRLTEQTDALQRWGADLDHKVAERTQELANANQTLRAAQQRLVMSEKLAAIGQLAAGVAHEVNNPVAVIQGNLDILRDTLGDAATPVLGEIRLIQDQVFRIRLIVTKLLQFARPAEYTGHIERVMMDQVVQDSLVLVAHQMKKSSVSVLQELHSRKAVLASRNELQQVIINLMVNALQAMSAQEGATLTLVTGDSQRDGMDGSFIAIADSGPGISAADRERLFDPFFTTKQEEGTGLGLWVSLGLVQRYGGRIEVTSPIGGGSVFTVWLPGETVTPGGH